VLELMLKKRMMTAPAKIARETTTWTVGPRKKRKRNPTVHGVLVTSQQKEKKMKKQLLALRNQDTTNHSRRTKGRGNTRRLSEGWS